MVSSKTLEYYNNNAKAYIADTVNANLKEAYNKFLRRLPKQALLLDFGCGSGRDTKYFLEQGYMVEAIDGSKEFCRLASDYTGIQVRQLLFQEFEENSKYDGIWACASILHLPKPELVSVLQKMREAVKPDGAIYTSFKYGNFEGECNGRYYVNLTEESFSGLLETISGLRIEEQWVTNDVRPNRGEEKWLNLILKK